MLEGAMEPKTIAERVAKLGFPAVALTDRNGLYGAMAFSEACMAKGVQPIVGAMLGVARPGEIGGEAAIDWLALLAKDEQGYANLCKLVSQAHLDRPVEQEPHVEFPRLEGLSDGLIAMTAESEGALVRLIADGQQLKAEAYLDQLERLFPDRLYIELSRRNDAVEDAAETGLIDLAYARHLPLVGTNPAAYADPSFHAAHDAMLCIANSAYVESAERVTSSLTPGSRIRQQCRSFSPISPKRWRIRSSSHSAVRSPRPSEGPSCRGLVRMRMKSSGAMHVRGLMRD